MLAPVEEVAETAHDPPHLKSTKFETSKSPIKAVTSNEPKWVPDARTSNFWLKSIKDFGKHRDWRWRRRLRKWNSKTQPKFLCLAAPYAKNNQEQIWFVKTWWQATTSWRFYLGGRVIKAKFGWGSWGDTRHHEFWVCSVRMEQVAKKRIGRARSKKIWLYDANQEFGHDPPLL